MLSRARAALRRIVDPGSIALFTHKPKSVEPIDGSHQAYVIMDFHVVKLNQQSSTKV